MTQSRPWQPGTSGRLLSAAIVTLAAVPHVSPRPASAVDRPLASRSLLPPLQPRRHLVLGLQQRAAERTEEHRVIVEARPADLRPRGRQVQHVVLNENEAARGAHGRCQALAATAERARVDFLHGPQTYDSKRPRAWTLLAPRSSRAVRRVPQRPASSALAPACVPATAAAPHVASGARCQSGRRPKIFQGTT